MGDFQVESHNTQKNVSAVILDLDGTLLNSEQATKGILKEFLERYGKVIDEDKENKRFGMTHKESAIAIVRDYDLPLTPDQFTQEIMPIYRDKWMKVQALPGANRLIKHLHKHGVPIALASNSISENIDVKISCQQGWKESFSVVLGSDQVKSGKPSPDLFLEAANRMGVHAACCLVIEDSLVGVRAGKAAGMKVVAVPSLQNDFDRHFIADIVLHSLLEFQPEIWGLPAFDDWIDNALPIEPIHFTVLFSSGLLREYADDGPSALPDQVFGIYFGWAKVDACQIFKVVMSIGQDRSCCTFKRTFKVCLIDGSIENTSDQQMQVMLVGYIRRLSSMGDASCSIGIVEVDKCIARASLDLPAFTQLPFII